jgi:hypothetical protein
VTGYTRELDELRSAESERLSQSASDHENQMSQLGQQKQDALRDRQEYVDGHMENWQRERLFQIRADQHKKDEASRRTLVEQSEAELRYVDEPQQQGGRGEGAPAEARTPPRDEGVQDPPPGPLLVHCG